MAAAIRQNWLTYSNCMGKCFFPRIEDLLLTVVGVWAVCLISDIPPRQDDRLFPDDTFKSTCRPAPSHYLNQWWLVYWRKYASLDLNELKPFSSDKAKVCTTYYSICYNVHMQLTLRYTIPITYATLPSKAEYITLRHRAWFMLLLHG